MQSLGREDFLEAGMATHSSVLAWKIPWAAWWATVQRDANSWTRLKRLGTYKLLISINSISRSCPTLCTPMDCCILGFPVLHLLLELAQTHVHRASDASQPSHPLLCPSSPAFNVFQHGGLENLNELRALSLSSLCFLRK